MPTSGLIREVIVEPAEVSFHKSWQSSYNATVRGASGRISDREVEDAISKGVSASTNVIIDAWRKGGYQIVDAAGPDVLRVKTGILNISVAAPEVHTTSPSRTFSEEAAHATLVVELRDSMTGALLGRAVDQNVAGDTTIGWRTSVSNRSDFRELVQSWANDSMRG